MLPPLTPLAIKVVLGAPPDHIGVRLQGDSVMEWPPSPQHKQTNKANIMSGKFCILFDHMSESFIFSDVRCRNAYFCKGGHGYSELGLVGLG